MRNFRRDIPTVNAGSMADIAFLLLIFFLVTTTISADKGILRKLPAECNAPPCIVDFNERNVFIIFINRNDEIMVEDKIINIGDLKDLSKAFIDNNGENACDYCNGEQLITSSDKPSEAVIFLKHDALTNYGAFILAQDEISKAYYDLRSNYVKKVLNKSSKS